MMPSWLFAPPVLESRKRARVGLSIDSSDNESENSLLDQQEDTIDRSAMQLPSPLQASLSEPEAVLSVARPTAWAIDWSNVESSDDESFPRRDASFSDPLEDSSLDDSVRPSPFLPSPSDFSRGDAPARRPPSFLLPAPLLVYPNNNRSTRRRARTHEDRDFWPTGVAENSTSADNSGAATDAATATVPWKRRRFQRNPFWTPYRLLMTLFMFATYTTFWLPFPTAPPATATYSLRGSGVSLDRLPTLRDDRLEQQQQQRAGSFRNNNSLAHARGGNSQSLVYRRRRAEELYYQQDAFQTDAFFRCSWYCNVAILGVFVLAGAREYKSARHCRL